MGCSTLYQRTEDVSPRPHGRPLGCASPHIQRLPKIEAYSLSQPRPLYFGTEIPANRHLYRWGHGSLFGTEGWRNVLHRHNWTTEEVNALTKRAPKVSYATGGFYGFNRPAIEHVARSPCMEDAAAAVRNFGASHQLAGIFEDELVGLCMHAHRVRLVSCGCFYQYGPCDCRNVTTCQDGQPSTRLCRLPLSIHKLKKAEWYLPWWQFLTQREERHLAELKLH